MNLPSAIQTYFDADRRNDGAALIRAFAPDALVHDEGRSHAGHHAIEAWWREVKAKYQNVIVPLEVVEKDDVTQVRARVSGHFSGSPITLTFTFWLDREQINEPGDRRMTSALADKVVLVTGASKGIGAGIATAFGAAGANVAVSYARDQEGAERVAAEIGVAGATNHHSSTNQRTLP